MLATPAIRNLIRENKIAQMPSIMQTSKAMGMMTMEAAVKELLARNLVTMDEVSFYLPVNLLRGDDMDALKNCLKHMAETRRLRYLFDRGSAPHVPHRGDRRPYGEAWTC